MNKDRIIRELDLRKFGAKGWMRSNMCECPNCSRSDKFGLMLSVKGGVAYCFYCDKSIPLIRYIRDIGRGDLVSDIHYVELSEKLPELLGNKGGESSELIQISKPLGFKEILSDKYLDNRKFLPQHYNLFNPGKSALEPYLTNDYIIFLLYIRENLVGWLARSMFTKEWHDNNLLQYKEGLSPLILRYRNSTSDFSKIVGGFNDITQETDTVIITEGIFDKVSVDKELRLYDDKYVRCVFTFGNKISTHQINLLKETNIKNIILMYDKDALSQIREYSVELSKYFSTTVAEIKSNKDPGDMGQKEILESLSNLRESYYFYKSRI